MGAAPPGEDGVTVRTATVEDDSRYRTGLQALLEHSGDFELVDSFSSADAALTALAERTARGEGPAWDLVLMDLDLPGTDGIAATQTVKALAPGVSVVVLTVFEESHTVLRAICAGADGYLAKRAQPAEILDELRSVMSGGAPLSAGVARTVLTLLRHQAGNRDRVAPSPGGPSRLDLTDREQEVLRCLVGGMAYKQVARELGISHDTVRSHVRSVYSKLQVHTVSEAVSRAIREGLV
jgi:DNA-binding NarL/FixJ family response regulator